MSIAALFTLAAPRVQAQERDLTDPDIRDAVERELLYDDAVPSQPIDVRVSEGVVTLTGRVESLLASERAVRIAECVKGVRSIVNRVAVEPREELSDDALSDRVQRALFDDPATDAYEVEVTARSGLVTLDGTVDSWTERELCGTVAKGVRGVRELENKLYVDYVSERSDAEIEAEIERALRWDALVDADQIEVTVSEGAVSLAGIVGSVAERRRARIDAWTSGVRSVDDSGLEVARWARDEDMRQTSPAPPSDRELAQAVSAALLRDPRVSAFNVTASARDGVVTLRGVVADLKARRAAAQDARNTVGTAMVRNQLKVRPSAPRTDEQIQVDAVAALLRDPFVDAHQVQVEVDGGEVRLTGTVDSVFERGQADDAAARVDGVTRVINRLEVEALPYAYDPYVDDWYVYDFDWYLPGPPTYSFLADVQLQRQIEEEFYWSPFVDADQVQVTVVDGVATLTGEVDSWAEYGAARDNAYEGGATFVRNRLTVSDGPGSAAD